MASLICASVAALLSTSQPSSSLIAVSPSYAIAFHPESETEPGVRSATLKTPSSWTADSLGVVESLTPPLHPTRKTSATANQLFIGRFYLAASAVSLRPHQAKLALGPDQPGILGDRLVQLCDRGVVRC